MIPRDPDNADLPVIIYHILLQQKGKPIEVPCEKYSGSFIQFEMAFREDGPGDTKLVVKLKGQYGQLENN